MQFNTNNIDKETAIKILKDAYNICENFQVDILDCRIAWYRRTVNMTFQNFIKLHMYDDAHFSIFIRKNLIDRVAPHKYIEFSIRSMTTPDYFLWINVDIKHLQYFIEKYKLVRLL